MRAHCSARRAMWREIQLKNKALLMLQLTMASHKKCHVCCCKSSSRWYCIVDNIVEDVENCFNVETSCDDACLCASCRRNLTRRRRSCDGDKEKYFAKAQSRGKAFVNKITLAQQDRRLAVTDIAETKTTPVSLLLCLPEVVLLDIFRYVGSADICNLRLTCQYVNIICASNYLWKCLLERDFPDAVPLLHNTVLSASSVAYRFLYSATLSSKKNAISHRRQIGELERQFRESESKFLVGNAELQRRVDNLQSKLLTRQNDRDPNTPVSKLQEQVTSNS